MQMQEMALEIDKRAQENSEIEKEEHSPEKIRRIISRLCLITLGAFIMAIGLEMALIPNSLVDGGVTGVSIMIADLSGLKLGLFLVLFNLPFLYLGYKQIGRSFAFSTAYGIIVLSLSTVMMHHSEPFTNDILLATIIGGILIGIGVGIAIKSGGCLDGTETLAILLSQKTPFSVGQIILIINLFILGSAGFLYGFDRFMYSFLAYFIAFKTIDLVTVGMDESKSLIIVSDKYEKIASALMARLGRGVTILYGEGGYSKQEKKIIYCVITRLEETKVKSMISQIDSKAMVALGNVSEIQGGSFKKKNIH